MAGKYPGGAVPILDEANPESLYINPLPRVLTGIVVSVSVTAFFGTHSSIIQIIRYYRCSTNSGDEKRGVKEMTAAITANLPVFVVIAPLFVAFVLPTFARRMRVVEGLVIFAEALGLVGAGYMATIVLAQKGIPIIYSLGGWQAPWGIELEVGSLGAFFLLVIAVVSLPVALFAKGNLSEEVGSKERVTRFYVLYLLLGGALAGMAVTNDLFNVFVLVEVATLSCCRFGECPKSPSCC